MSAFRVDVEVHVLDATQDGLAQIATILKGRSNVEALHIVGHGSAGSLNLGSLTLNGDSIGAFGDVLNRIGAALTEDGDILLYGCDVAGGALGAQFVGQIAQATGADVAASTDPTGGDARGGNWTLEYRQGEVTRDGALDAETARSLGTLLAQPSAPDLTTESDSGVSPSDNVTNASTLSFSGSGAAGDSSSTVRVFVDRNGNGVYDAGIDASGTATVDNGAWSVNAIDVADIADGKYNVYSLVTSSDGNLTSVQSEALEVTLDRISPTLAITSDRSTLKAGETATITFTFSEDPGATFTWDGSAGDVVVSGGTLSAISGSGLTRTATFTPSANTNGGTASITVPAASYTDTAGNNGGAGATSSLTFDTLAPTVASITRVGTETSNATSVEYTVTFDSSVSGVDPNDFQLTGTGNTNGTIASVTGSGTTYTVAVNSISGNGTLRLDLKNTGTGITDAAGNAAPGFTGGQTYIFDNTAPAVTSVAVPAAATYRAGDPLELTVNFSEAVFVVTTGGTPSINITLDTGGTVQAYYVSGSGSTALKFQYTVVAGNADANGILVAGEFSPNGGTIRDAVGNDAASALNSVAPTSGVLVNALAPTVTSIVVRDGAALTSVNFIVTFSESVQGVSIDDFTLVGDGASGSIASVIGGGDTWTIVVDDISGDGTLRLDLNASGTGIVASSSGQVLAGGFTDGEAYTFDSTPPVLDGAITISDSALKIGDSATVTFRFTEAVKDFTVGDVTVPNGELSNLTTSDGGKTWTATLTPNDGASAAGNVLTLNYAGITDLAGNANTGSASSDNYAVDTVRPHLASAIAISQDTLAIGGSATVTFVFNEAVTGFSVTDVIVPNGTLQDLRTTDNITYTATLRPAAGSNQASNALTLDYSGITDQAGNAGIGIGTSANYAVDTVRPTLAQDISISHTALGAGQSATVVFTFTEAVTNFSAADVTAPNAVLRDLTPSNGGRTWTATLVPNTDTTDATNVLTLNYAGITDLAGNAGSGSVNSINYAVNTNTPRLAKPIEISSTTLGIGSSATVTFTFTEAVLGFDAGDVTVPNGTLSMPTTSDGITWTATLTPNANSAASSNVLTVDLSGIINGAGNFGVGRVDSTIAYAVDTVRPGIERIEISNAALASGETATVTFIFNEAVLGFDADAVTVPNGTLSAPTSSDGITWTAVLTPDQGTRTAMNVLEVDLSGITDMAGNAGTGTARSDNYAIDTTAPVLASPILIDDVALKIGDSTTVTFVFDQAVQGFSAADVTVPNGVLTDPVSNDGGITWTATLTPNQGATAASNVLTLDYTGITNMAGNAGIGSARSGNYAVDTRAPTATVTLNDIDLRAGETATVTVTFSEIVSGFDKSAVSAPNGTLGDFVTTDGGKTWSATFTPSENISAATNIMSVRLAGMRDEAGNTGAGSATSPSYAVQTNPPATTIDGVTVERQTLPVDPATGLASTVLTVPLITGNRPDDPSTPNSGLADIPLGLGSGSGPRTQLLVSLPVGTGIRAEGPSMLLTNEQALLDLIGRIENQTADGSSAQLGMTSDASGFLSSLAPDTLLHSQALVLSAAPGLSSPQTIFISGNSTTPVGGHNATAIGLIIDTTGLPLGSTLQLNNVDFAAIIGAVTVRGGDGRNFVRGDDSRQNIVLGADDDTLHGGGGNDYIGSHGGNDWLYGDDGNDTVSGGQGNDWLFGGNGHDRLLGGTGHDRLDGGTGNDRLYGESGNDTLSGGTGNDSLWGGAGHDRLNGGSGKDNLRGDSGNDTLHGGAGNDALWGGSGKDRLYGEAGNDTLRGEAGNDWIVGGLGRDNLWGGSGSDTFAFHSIQESRVGTQRDVIHDFEAGWDKIDLRKIDANQNVKGNQAFFWAGAKGPFLYLDEGTAGFSGRAGEMRYADGILMGDTNGDGVADFEIRIIGSFSRGDVIL